MAVLNEGREKGKCRVVPQSNNTGTKKRQQSRRTTDTHPLSLSHSLAGAPPSPPAFFSLLTSAKACLFLPIFQREKAKIGRFSVVFVFCLPFFFFLPLIKGRMTPHAQEPFSKPGKSRIIINHHRN